MLINTPKHASHAESCYSYFESPYSLFVYILNLFQSYPKAMCNRLQYAYKCGHPAGQKFDTELCDGKCEHPVVDIVELPTNCRRCSLNMADKKDMDIHVASRPELIKESDVRHDVNWCVPAKRSRMVWETPDPFQTKIQPRRKARGEEEVSPKSKAGYLTRWERATAHLPSSWKKQGPFRGIKNKN